MTAILARCLLWAALALEFAVVAPIMAVIGVAHVASRAHRRLVITAYYHGDEAAYERDQWRDQGR